MLIVMVDPMGLTGAASRVNTGSVCPSGILPSYTSQHMLANTLTTQINWINQFLIGAARHNNMFFRYLKKKKQEGT